MKILFQNKTCVWGVELVGWGGQQDQIQMKIIAHIPYGYLVAVSAPEMAQLTGEPKHSRIPEDRYNYGDRLPINHEMDISKTWDHLRKLQETPEIRRRIAESLRAAATLVEHTPDPLSPGSPNGYLPTTPTA